MMIRGLLPKSRLTPIPKENLFWQANQNNPYLHNSNHAGLYYQLPLEESKLIDIFGLQTPFRREYEKFYKAIDMKPIMIREQALKAIDYLKQIDYENQQSVRILLYGDRGHGKTQILFHLVHYLQAANLEANDNNIIIHVRDMKKFAIHPSDKQTSLSRKNRLDTPLDAALMLQKFKLMNLKQLDKHKDVLVSSQDYSWTSKEKTVKGEPLVNVIDHGVNRLSHASDCLAVLIKELMLASETGKFKLISALENVQFLYTDLAYNLKYDDRKRVYIDEVTVARALKKLIVGNHKSGTVLATVDDKMTSKQDLLPNEFLKNIEAWKAFDPFLPIHVPKYSRKEFESCMNFMQDVGWLARPESRTLEGRDEIRFISGLNPREVHEICEPL